MSYPINLISELLDNHEIEKYVKNVSEEELSKRIEFVLDKFIPTDHKDYILDKYKNQLDLKDIAKKHNIYTKILYNIIPKTIKTLRSLKCTKYIKYGINCIEDRFSKISPEELYLNILEINTSIIKHLYSAGIKTFRDLCDLSYKQLLTIPYISVKSADALQEELKLYGYKLNLKEPKRVYPIEKHWPYSLYLRIFKLKTVEELQSQFKFSVIQYRTYLSQILATSIMRNCATKSEDMIDESDIIFQIYKNRKTHKQVAKKYNITDTDVRKILQKLFYRFRKDLTLDYIIDNLPSESPVVLDEDDLQTLHLNTRLYNALVNHLKITKVSELVEHSKRDLLKGYGVGAPSIAEIEESLKQRNLELKQSEHELSDEDYTKNAFVYNILKVVFNKEDILSISESHNFNVDILNIDNKNELVNRVNFVLEECSSEGRKVLRYKWDTDSIIETPIEKISKELNLSIPTIHLIYKSAVATLRRANNKRILLRGVSPSIEVFEPKECVVTANFDYEVAFKMIENEKDCIWPSSQSVDYLKHHHVTELNLSNTAMNILNIYNFKTLYDLVGTSYYHIRTKINKTFQDDMNLASCILAEIVIALKCFGVVPIDTPKKYLYSTQYVW